MQADSGGGWICEVDGKYDNLPFSDIPLSLLLTVIIGYH